MVNGNRRVIEMGPLVPGVVASMVRKARALDVLDLTRTRSLDDWVLRHVGQSCSVLRVLSLRGAHYVTDDGMEELSRCTTLRDLDIGHCSGISDEGFRFLARLVRLQILRLDGCPMVRPTAPSLP